MAVTYQKSIDAKNGNSIRFLLINFDYIDGNEYLVKLFVEEYGFIVQEKIDGLWYHIIRVSLGSTIYELLWHEDTGNEIYLRYSLNYDIITINTKAVHEETNTWENWIYLQRST